MALNSQQQQVGQMLYQLAVQRGIPPPRAREFVSAALAESGLRPGATNRSSGAAGLFQLLSGGYRQRAKSLGGLYNPKANALAILPDYQRYWRQHPHAAPGEAGRDVERSGAGAGFYSRGLQQLGNLGGGGANAPQSAPPTGGVSAAPDQQDIGRALLQAFQAGPEHGNFSDVYSLVNQQRQPQAPRAASVSGLLGSAPQNDGVLGHATLGHGADRAGMKTSPAVLRFVRRISGLAGEALTIGTGTQHSRMTVNGNVSDHWSGHGADIPASGRELIRLGRLALIAAGMSRGRAMKQTGGLFNVGGHQVIFNTHIGGDHTNHLHVSAY